MTPRDACAIAVLAKEPLPGRVKTRLCPPYSLEQAALLAAAALMDTLDVVTQMKCPIRRVIVFDGDASLWRRPGFEVIAQHGDGLAERLGNALVDVAALTGLPVLLVGMDTPHVESRTLDSAVVDLLAGDAVLGPATDGGFRGNRASGAQTRALCRRPDVAGGQGAQAARPARTAWPPRDDAGDSHRCRRRGDRECRRTRSARHSFRSSAHGDQSRSVSP